jgi:hypothetical protein
MNNDRTILNWLLEEDNPGVRTRTLKELVGLVDDHIDVIRSRNTVKETLKAANDLSWMKLKGQILIYNLTALAESGLSYRDVKLEPVIDKVLSLPYDMGCGDLMTLRALVMLGCGTEPRVIERIQQLAKGILPDGGWLCLHRVNKLNRIPKSCIKVNMHGLLLASELKKKGIKMENSDQLIQYFLKRRLFFRMDQPTKLVLNLPGRRMTDVFFPNELFHVGLPVLLEALSSLGVGNKNELKEAWNILNEKKDSQGKIILGGTLPSNKSYLPRERVGRPSKWGTLYAYIAWNNRNK